eukprot:gb/GECG01001128.1/.p1 GENE.gb/GECG01001128.1/~~gb/GECG01001128.1/.p1  ORF type:complete len:120 (+),score=9.70 gb/GECG01001128.1/:1-360(+)
MMPATLPPQLAREKNEALNKLSTSRQRKQEKVKTGKRTPRHIVYGSYRLVDLRLVILGEPHDGVPRGVPVVPFSFVCVNKHSKLLRNVSYVSSSEASKRFAWSLDALSTPLRPVGPRKN